MNKSSVFPWCRNIIIDKLFLNLRNLKVDVLICLKNRYICVSKKLNVMINIKFKPTIVLLTAIHWISNYLGNRRARKN
jgi:hypothetical protein